MNDGNIQVNAMEIVPDIKNVQMIEAVHTINVQALDRDNTDWFQIELDSHADTCCVGKDVLIVNETHRMVNVTPFLQSLGMERQVPIVSAAVTYGNPHLGEVFILIFHQALHFNNMDHCLICPMQLRLNDVVINEQPKFLVHCPSEKDHAIIAENLLIPLELSGVTSFFPAHKPTMEKYDKCMQIELTSPNPEWKPHDVQYLEEESTYIHSNGTLCDRVCSIAEQQSHNEE
jgi:hypothetical protein